MSSLETIRQFYDEHYYRDLRPSRPPEHYDLYLRLLHVKRGARLLDVGCGLGLLLERAQRGHIDCAGIDLSERAITEARRRVPTADLRVGPAAPLPWPDASFDYVTCLGSLEHFLDQPGALREMRRVASADAQFLIMVPNLDYIDAGTEQAAVQETLRSLADWSKVLIAHGFTILDVSPDRWPVHWVPLPKRRPLTFARGLYRRWKVWSLPLDRSYQFIFHCR